MARFIRFLAGTLPLCVLLTGLCGCATPEEKLAAALGREAFWEGRGTARQYMTDRIISPETQRLLRDLSAPEKSRREEAAERLSRLRELIEFGRKWDVPPLEINPSEAARPPVIDGKIGRDEWKETMEITGSCRAGRRRRNFDGSRLVFKYDRENLYIAAHYPLTPDGSGKRHFTGDDHVLVYFDLPGENARYMECIISPSKDGLAATIPWVYCGNGGREQLAYPRIGREIMAFASETPYGYAFEMSIPRSLLGTDRNGCCRVGVLRWDTGLSDYRVPVPIPYSGHDIFNRIRLRLPKAQ